MELTLIVPPIAETNASGYRGSLLKKYYGKDYEFKFVNNETTIIVNGKPVYKDAVVAGAVPTRLLVAIAEAAKSYNLIGVRS